MTDSPPTARELNPIPADLDGQYAVRHFLGKSESDAQEMFEYAFDIYQEDLLFMGPVAFRFYLPAAMRYAESDDVRQDLYVAETMLMLIRERWSQNRHELQSVREIMASYVQSLNRRIAVLEASQMTKQQMANQCGELLQRLK